MEKAKGIKKYKFPVIKSHGDVKDSIGNGVHNTVITVCGVRWVLDVSGVPSQVT